MPRSAVLLLAVLPAMAGAAGETTAPAWPPVREITFVGNDTTRSDVLLREMSVRVGDPADPERLERSRQAIQDLRLFRSVVLEQRPLEGGVGVTVTVDEKHYLLPLPRASLNSDGQYSYGLGLRWWNLFGLNHTLHFTVAEGSRAEVGRGTLLRYHASYDVPFLFDSPYGLVAEYIHSEEPVTDDLFSEEITDNARVLLSRSLGGGSHGWRLGAGLQWQQQERLGPVPLASPGQATALVLRADYDGERFDIYSEQGRRFSLEARSTAGTLASDYAYHELLGSYEQAWAVGNTPHQTFEVFARAAAYGGGTRGVPPPYSLGGAEGLRGYPLNLLRGERYAYGGVEYLHPLGWDWLRAAVFLEAGDIHGGVDGPDGVFADVGIGLRLRWSGFVRTEFNFGFAYPLVEAKEGESGRFVASGQR